MEPTQPSRFEERVLAVVREAVPRLPVEVERSCGQLALVVPREAVVTVCRALKHDPETRFDYLADLCGVDYLGRRERRFQVVYNLYSIARNHRLRLKVDVDESEPWIPSVTGVWKTANWHERELYDMFGIEVRDHPDLRRILMPDEWEGYPLRKDYPLRGKGQRDDFSFVPREDRPPPRRPAPPPEPW